MSLQIITSPGNGTAVSASTTNNSINNSNSSSINGSGTLNLSGSSGVNNSSGTGSSGVGGPRTVVLQRQNNDFGFTLRHFIVYPPESCTVSYTLESRGIII